MNTEQTIIEKLQHALDPVLLDVVNESHMHNVPANSETHFKVIAVSAVFEGQTLVSRHRKINSVLAELLAGGVHALGLHTFTAEEWELRKGKVALSPKCLGGSKAARSPVADS